MLSRQACAEPSYCYDYSENTTHSVAFDLASGIGRRLHPVVSVVVHCQRPLPKFWVRLLGGPDMTGCCSQPVICNCIRV